MYEAIDPAIPDRIKIKLDWSDPGRTWYPNILAPSPTGMAMIKGAMWQTAKTTIIAEILIIIGFLTTLEELHAGVKLDFNQGASQKLFN